MMERELKQLQRRAGLTALLLTQTGCVGFATTATNAVYLVGGVAFLLVYLGGKMIEDEGQRTVGWILRIVGLLLFVLA